MRRKRREKMTLQQIYQSYLDSTPDVQVAEAVRASANVLNYLNSQTSEENASATYLMLIATYVGIDGTVQGTEYEFCKAVFGFDFDYDSFFDMVNSVLNSETIEFIDSVIDSAPANIKADFVSLGIAICACNGTLTVSEQRLLEKYLD